MMGRTWEQYGLSEREQALAQELYDRLNAGLSDEEASILKVVAEEIVFQRTELRTRTKKYQREYLGAFKRKAKEASRPLRV